MRADSAVAAPRLLHFRRTRSHVPSRPHPYLERPSAPQPERRTASTPPTSCFLLSEPDPTVSRTAVPRRARVQRPRGELRRVRFERGRRARATSRLRRARVLPLYARRSPVVLPCGIFARESRCERNRSGVRQPEEQEEEVNRSDPFHSV